MFHGLNHICFCLHGTLIVKSRVVGYKNRTGSIQVKMHSESKGKSLSSSRK